MNQINIVIPYRENIPWGDGRRITRMWVFDDPAKNFLREPFVAGMGDMLDRVSADIPNSENGFMLVFSDHSFPTGFLQMHVLKIVSEEFGGAWYQGKIDGVRMHGWLCQGLMEYFDSPPDRIYLVAQRLIDLSLGPPQAEAGDGERRQGGKEKRGEIKVWPDEAMKKLLVAMRIQKIEDALSA